MTIFNTLRHRKDHTIAEGVIHPESEDGKNGANVINDSSASDSDTLSLEAQNEKEVQAHPDQITRNADQGVQKAEAAALVWSKKTVLATYGWYAHHQTLTKATPS